MDALVAAAAAVTRTWSPADRGGRGVRDVARSALPTVALGVVDVEFVSPRAADVITASAVMDTTSPARAPIGADPSFLGPAATTVAMLGMRR